MEDIVDIPLDIPKIAMYIGDLYNERIVIVNEHGYNERIKTPKGKLLTAMINTLEDYYNTRLTSDKMHLFFYMYMRVIGTGYFTGGEEELAQEIMDNVMELLGVTSYSDLDDIMRREIKFQFDTLEYMTANPRPREREFFTVTEEQHERLKERLLKEKNMFLTYLTETV